MLDCVFNTSLGIALSSVKKRNLVACNRWPKTFLRRPLNVLKGHPCEVKLGRLRDVRWDYHQEDRWGRLGTLEGDVIGTSWDQYLSAGNNVVFCFYLWKVISCVSCSVCITFKRWHKNSIHSLETRINQIIGSNN